MFRKKKTVVLCLRPPQNRTFHVVSRFTLLTCNDFGSITPGRHIFCNVTNFKETLERVYSHAELFMYRT